MTDHDDAQRVLEQRALRNVRALVDKLEAGDGHRIAARAAIGFFVVAVAASVGVIAWLLLPRSIGPEESVVAAPARSAPARSAPEAQARLAELEREMEAFEAERKAFKARGVPMTGEMARLDEEIERKLAEYRARPRKTFIGTKVDPRFAPYVSLVAARVESQMNSNYPAEIRGITGSVQMTFAIRRDGALEGVEINRKAADHRLDAAAVRAVREAAPFPPFPDEFTKETDFLYITRTFGFTASGT